MEALAHFCGGTLNNHNRFAIFVAPFTYENFSEKSLSDNPVLFIFYCSWTRDPSVERY
ncbi:conserved hypothetical protein [Vibrio rotiferianus]|nr:conserved hypothetical protein [Vibrio rotiferianus]